MPVLVQGPEEELATCHWVEQLTPLDTLAVSERLPPLHIVPLLLMLIEGSGTTVTVTMLETGSEQPLPVQLRMAR